MSYITLYYHPFISPNYHYHPIFFGLARNDLTHPTSSSDLCRFPTATPLGSASKPCSFSPPAMIASISRHQHLIFRVIWSPHLSTHGWVPFSSPEAGGLLRETLKIEEVSCSSPALKCINRSMIFVETGYCDDETIIEN